MKDFSEIRQSEEVLEEGLQDPPMIVVLRRTAIRLFPGNQRVALYTNDRLGIEVSVPYEHGQIGGKKITAVMKEQSDREAQAANRLGEYLHALTHNDVARADSLRSDFAKHHGKLAADHLHLTATNYKNGEYKKADHHWRKMFSHINEERQTPVLQEHAIHLIHKIAKTGQDGHVVFKNGATARMSAQQALAIVKLHKALTPENKKRLEDAVGGSPEEMRKVHEFSKENLK